MIKLLNIEPKLSILVIIIIVSKDNAVKFCKYIYI